LASVIQGSPGSEGSTVASSALLRQFIFLNELIVKYFCKRVGTRHPMQADELSPKAEAEAIAPLSR
jgi:hypothetical protein